MRLPTSFLARLSLFLAPFLALWLAAEMSLARVPRSCAAKRAILESAPPGATFIFGSSHEANGLAPAELFPNTFSLANGSQSIHYDGLLLRRALDTVRAPRRVLLGISYHTLAGNLCASGDAWRCGEYYREFGFEGEPGWHWFSLTNFCGLAICTPEQSREMFLSQLRGADLTKPWPKDGFMAQRGRVVSLDSDRGRRRVRQHQAGMSSANEARNLGVLRAMAQLLRTRAVAAYIVVSPVLPPYTEALSDGEREHFVEVLRNFGESERIPVLDHWQDTRFPMSLFANEDHLNAEGAVAFSRIVRDEILARER
jgi:hypothetical protein